MPLRASSGFLPMTVTSSVAGAVSAKAGATKAAASNAEPESERQVMLEDLNVITL